MNNHTVIERSSRSLVLDNPDLLGVIFEHYGGRKSTTNEWLNPFPAVFTCKAFSNPALNALWKSLDSLLPLLKLLPSFTKIDGDSYRLQGVVNSVDWNRFDSYAERVRYFDHRDHHANAVIPQDVYFRLAQLRTSPLLPNLREFRCSSLASLNCGIFIFLSPSLRLVHLLVSHTSQDHVVGAFLSALFSEVPNLQHLSLHGILSKNSLSFVGRLEGLLSLSLTNLATSVDLAFLKQIWTFHSLRRLEIDLSHNDLPYNRPWMDWGDDGLTPGLKELKEITTHGGSLQLVTRLMTLIQSTSIESIIVKDVKPGNFEEMFYENPVIAEFQNLLSSWNRWSHILRRIEISHVIPDLAGTSISLFAPLSAHSNLTHFDLSNCSVPHYFTESDIYKLVNYWPSLVFLAFPLAIQNREPTLNALVSIAKCCPRLRVLLIPLITQLPSLDDTPLLKHGLQTLQFNTACGANINLAARHLDRLFPGIVSLSSVISEYDEQWEKVADLVKIFQDVRRESGA